MAESINVVSFRDFIDPQQKTTDWILGAVKNNYYYGGARSLLHGKDVEEIKNYASGKHSMAKFEAMFPETKKRKRDHPDGAPRGSMEPPKNNFIDKRLAVRMGIDFKPLGILQQPLASAIATLQKQTHEISFTAVDAVANDKRKKDLQILAGRPAFDEAISMAKNAAQMPLAPPMPQNNTPTIDIQQVGLDPAQEDELNIYADLFYKLRGETAFEVAVQALMDSNDFKMKMDLEKKDQVYFGVSANRTYISDITGLPRYDYEFPGNVYAPPSDLPDFSDVSFLHTIKTYNVEQLLECVGAETLPEQFIINVHEAYWKGLGTPMKWDTAPDDQKRKGVRVLYQEFKSFDVLRIKKAQTAGGRTVSSVVPFDYRLNPDGKKGSSISLQTKFPEQTYFAYWVVGTDIILKSGKVVGMSRARGKESKSRFTINIEKSKEKSDVEQCITHVDDAQRAYIKMQQAIIMAKPKGQYFDMKYIRNAVEQLEEDIDTSVESLLQLFAVHNVMIGDTEGLDGQNEGQFMPVRDIQGGIGTEVREYLSIIADANQAIARVTGFNDALTGQAPNPDALVGLQKLMLQSAVNSLYYAQKAAKRQTEKLVGSWAPMVQYICKPEHHQTDARQALENIIGSIKVAIINDMGDLSAHQFGYLVQDAPSEDQQNELRQLLMQLVQGQRIDLSDYFLVRRVLNYKDAQQLLIIKEKKKQAQIQQQLKDNNDAMVQSQQVRANADLQKTATTVQGNVQIAQQAGQTATSIQDQKARLELQVTQMEGEIERMKKQLQGQQQEQKILLKANMDAQK